jgi:transcriptional regulator with XRE-family HTH domain
MPRFDHLPDALRLLREQRGYSQRQLAEALGVEASMVGNWERGKRLPPTERLLQLADLYDLDLGALDDALEIAGARPRRRGLAADQVTPRRLAGLLLGGDQRPALDPTESELAALLEAVFKLAERLRARRR